MKFFGKRMLAAPLLAAALMALFGACSPGEQGATTADGAARGLAAANGCAVSGAGRAILENPKQENPATAFDASISGYGAAVEIGGLDGSCRLKNYHLRVVADGQYPESIASGPPFDFDSEDPRFQQVNAYYYANSLKDLVLSRGGSLDRLYDLSLDAHCSRRDNAYFSPSANAVCLGYTDLVPSNKRVWASDDADVIIHETAHAINHTISTTSILNSTNEAGAIDESIADYWALTINGNPMLSEWFLGAMETLFGPGLTRDASTDHHYPETIVYEMHDDSRPLTEVLWTLRSGALGVEKTDLLVIRTLGLLASTTRYKEAVTAMQTAAAAMSYSLAERAAINLALTNKGLIRTDDASELQLSTVNPHQQIYVMDDNFFTFQAGGNCNGQLDVGETALVMINLENAGDTKGLVVATLATPFPAGTTVPVGGEVGEFMRFDNGGADFVDVLHTPGVYSDDAALAAGFIIRATTAGVKNFTVNLRAMGGGTASVAFSLTVGNVATDGDCRDDDLWPGAAPY